jgi:hypothetical protein
MPMATVHKLHNPNQTLALSLAALNPMQREQAFALLHQINASFALLREVTANLRTLLRDLREVTGPRLCSMR